MLAFKCGCIQVGATTEFCAEHARRIKEASPAEIDAMTSEIWAGERVRVCTDCRRYEPQVKFNWGQSWCDECQEIRKARMVNSLEVQVAEDIGSSEAH